VTQTAGKERKHKIIMKYRNNNDNIMKYRKTDKLHSQSIKRLYVKLTKPNTNQNPTI